MRFRHADGTVVHLGYCANVHPVEDIEGVLAQLAVYAEPVRRLLAADRLGLGLWLARDVAAGLAADPAAVARLRAELDARGLEVVTLNGFPYSGFGDAAVKYRVYSPDWSDRRRAEYTADLATVLAGILPSDAVRGSISTLPLGWREPWPAVAQYAARSHIDAVAAHLAELTARTGTVIRVGFEPEPGCVIERTDQAIELLTGLDPSHFGVCVDTAHLAVAHEEPANALKALRDAGLPIVKVQASAALEAPQPDDPATRAALARFAEPRYLHQTREVGAGGLHGTDDLDEALSGDTLPADAPWRVHFHIPLHAEIEAPLTGTHDVLTRTLTEGFSGTPFTDHIEVETYTWQVLPEEERPRDARELARGIAAEMAWARRELIAAGLSEVSS
ncbi:metabolite traffic protein EboE [Catenulispora pinisilvae]|uniref:metabolite traffic protein EboE n=1 Tax=Catenulispora pinisilvae TaxID=2705253 RepID=UPI0018926DF9|nr:metabolite traffic protein EboE [Catenulispora pinisilvae]